MFRFITFIRPYARYLLAAWCLTIIIMSSIPNIPTLKVHAAGKVFRLDYLIHFTEYGLLTFLTFLSLAGEEFVVSYRKIFLISAGLLLFAFLDEFHQKLIPGRTYNIRDFLSNAGGIMVITMVTIIVLKFSNLRPPCPPKGNAI